MADTSSPMTHIALVCNHDLLAERLRNLLTGDNITLTHFTSWDEAREKLESTHVNAIIGCIDSIKDNYTEVHTFLHTPPFHDRIPVIVITPSQVDIDYFIHALSCGVSYHISLPCEKDYFIKRVNEIIATHTKERGVADTIRLDIPEGEVLKTFIIQRKQLTQNLLSSYHDDIQRKKALLKTGNGLDLLNDHDITSDGPPHRDDDSREKSSLEMISAIENGDFELYYQPIVCLKSGTISGFEALIRWNKRDTGFVSPDEFIPYAEESGLIISLGFWVIEEACRQLRVWHDTFTERPPVTVSVNMSTVQFIHPNLADQISEIVSSHGIPGPDIRFEITESALMTDMESANLMLLKLKSMNHKLYMDDFGTGYSSLSYLKHFPVDVLKIDQSFVRWMGVDEESDEIVNTIINLAHNLKKEVIAEGIETEEHLEKLRELGCEYGQGYLFSKPLNAESAAELIKNNPVW